MLIAGLDTETTGFSAPDGHRIVEIAIVTYDFETRRIIDRYEQRIDPDRNIPAAAQAVHGISYESLVGKPKWQDVAKVIQAKLDAADVAIAHNMGFDGPFIGHELLRIGLKLPNFEPFCTMENARWACPDGKLPKLGELCFALGVEYDPAKAHSALYDVTLMMDCFFKGLDRGFYNLPICVSSITLSTI
jgi:DNA polymerase-3 subunit epsilon